MEVLERAEARAAKVAATEGKDGGTERDPKLPTSVPMPKDVSEVKNVHVATLLNEGVAAAASPAAALADAPAPDV